MTTATIKVLMVLGVRAQAFQIALRSLSKTGWGRSDLIWLKELWQCINLLITFGSFLLNVWKESFCLHYIYLWLNPFLKKSFRLHILSMVRGSRLEPILAVFRQRLSTTWTGSQIIHRDHSHPDKFTNTDNVESWCLLTCMSLDCGSELEYDQRHHVDSPEAP